VIEDFDKLSKGEIEIHEDDILITAKTSNYWNQYLTNLKGIVTMDGSPTAHPMLIGRERNLPVICGVAGLVEAMRPYNGQ
jgi:phosphohistidine swiveling domain-containing protein